MPERNDNSQAREGPQVIEFLERIVAVETPYAVLNVVHDYLRAWPKVRVANLQRIDGGWAPFDRDQNPLPVNTLGKLDLFQEAVHRHCLALSLLNRQSTPELMELNEMLTIAHQFAKALGTAAFEELSANVGKRAAILKRR